ncbi:cyclic nucleotide-binding domain-containing protein [Kriegella sp. EG-1]|nr:cyclic nucleotide-binding domain-containing protein [Flavobacteriaceae bacterium EG-1]
MDYSFVDFVKSMLELQPALEKKFRELITIKNVNKENDFISVGQKPKSIAFVKKGLFRYYYSNESGEEFTKAFFPEGNILSSYSAIIEDRESYFTIEALEDSVIEVVNYTKLKNLFDGYPGWNIFLLAMLQKGFIKKEERERQFLLFDAEHRYRSFLELHPNLEQRIKQHIVASHIGVAPESLSRLRRKMGLLT